MTGTTRLAHTDAWTFVLPEGWARFPSGEGRERELDEAIRQVVGRVIPPDAPRDRAEPAKRLLHARMRAAIGDATRAGVSAVYLPIQAISGVIVPGSIVEHEFQADPGSDPTAVIDAILADGYDESEFLEIDGRPAARVISRLYDVEHSDGEERFSSHQVVYAMNRDEQHGSWLALSFSVLWNTAETELLADALVLFFDAVMTTFRWAGGIDLGPTTSTPGSTPMKAQDHQ